jgi:hypothetical protein
MTFLSFRNSNVMKNHTALDLGDHTEYEGSSDGLRICETCTFRNDGSHKFCARCGASLSGPLQTTGESVRPVDLSTAIVVTLVALFLGTLTLVGVFVIGSPIAAMGSKIAAEISKTPIPPRLDPSPSPTARYDSPASFSSIPEISPTPIVQSTLPPSAEFSVSDLPTFDDKKTKADPPDISAATVIAENANLRTSANGTSAVIVTVPQSSRVNVLRQAGPWFYVNWQGQRGWLHGNTIEFDLEG